MDHPDQLFNRMRRQKARPSLLRQRQDGVAPAPIQATAPARAGFSPQPPAASPDPPRPDAVHKRQDPPAVPIRPARGHALYSQVMRSHDRMGTRHL